MIRLPYVIKLSLDYSLDVTYMLSKFCISFVSLYKNMFYAILFSVISLLVNYVFYYNFLTIDIYDIC
jgi:hypothetical protein